MSEEPATPTEISYYRHLCGSVMYKTRGCRFNAASVLLFKERMSVITIALLSVYILSWSIASVAYPDVFTPQHARFFSVVSAIASISLLVISLLDYAFGRSVRAEKLHQNALQISDLMRSLERELEITSPRRDAMESLAKRYEEAIAETQINHTERDYRKFTYATARSETGSVNWLLTIRSSIYNLWFYASLMVFHAVLVTGLIGVTAYYSFNYMAE